MGTRFDPPLAIDIKTTSFTPITGNASGVTPIISAWQKLINVDTVAFALLTASVTGGVWTALVATDINGRDAKALPSSPTFPTGTNQNATVVIKMPNAGGYNYLQLTFTPSAGSGAVSATYGKIVGVPVSQHRDRQTGVHIYTPSGDSLAATNVLEYSANYDGRPVTGGPTNIPMLLNTAADPALWVAAIDSSNTALTIPAPAASGISKMLRLGIFEFGGIRFSTTITAGFGSIKVFVNGKS